MNNEEWKSAPEFEGWYEVSSLGRIRRIRPGKGAVVGYVLKLQTHKDGYVFVDLRKNGKRDARLISRLVCAAFYGACPVGHNCNHKDGNKSNNVASNLEWVTYSENIKHRHLVLGQALPDIQKHNPNRGKKGKDHPFSKTFIITKPDGAEIKIVGLKEFCRQNGLRQGCMSQLATGSGHSKTHQKYKCRYA